MKYRSEIDGLRTVAVVPVVLFHAGMTVFSGGFVGVDVFFVISGFLITTILLGDLERGRFSILRFYERRARRILPALFVVILACLPFAWAWMLPEILEDFAASLIAVALFFSNILFWRESNYFAPAAEEKPLLHTWSLAVEEQYYLFFPLLLWVLWRLRRERLMWAVVALTLSSFALNLWAQRNESISATAIFYLTPTRAWELFAGSVCAFLDRPERRRGNDLLAGLGLAMILAAIFLYDNTTPFPGVFALPPVVGTALILMFGRDGTRVAGLLSLKPFVAIGLISYSLYLWHQPLFAFARLRLIDEPPMALMMALAAISVALAYLSWRYVEQPFRRGDRSIFPGRARIFAFSGIGMAAMIALGAIGVIGKGFEGRMPPAYFERLASLKAQEKARLEAIGSGRCHFNRRGEARSLDVFLDHWTCGAGSNTGGAGSNTGGAGSNTGNSTSKNPGSGSTPLPGLYGDSHAADKAAALRANGFEVMQMTGAGCPLLPNTGNPVYCNRLLDTFIARAHESGVSTVILANRFDDEELTPAYLARIVAFWTSAFDQVYLFSPMPRFHGFKKVYLRDGRDAVGRLHFQDRAIRLFDAARAQTDLGSVRILSSKDYFCRARPGCSSVDDDALLLVDTSHMTVRGARDFGRTALDDGAFD